MHVVVEASSLIFGLYVTEKYNVPQHTSYMHVVVEVFLETTDPCFTKKKKKNNILKIKHNGCIGKY